MSECITRSISFEYSYDVNCVEAENEHFATSDSIIAWLETCKSDSTNNGAESGDTQKSKQNILGNLDGLGKTLPPPTAYHQLSAPGMAWSIIKKVAQDRGAQMELMSAIPHATEIFQSRHEDNHGRFKGKSPDRIIRGLESVPAIEFSKDSPLRLASAVETPGSPVRMRGNDEWAPPRAQIIFNIHEEANFKKLLQRQNYRCAGCGTKIDLDLARRLVLYCHYLGKYFCKCCFSDKTAPLPGYILQKWEFRKYPISHFALQLLDRIANEPLFNINDINPSLYRKVKKLCHLIDIRMQLYYLKIYISTCVQTEKLDQEYASFTHQHLLQDDVHLYSMNNLIEIQHGKLYEYLSDLVSRSIAHIAKCDRCRAKGHYCQLCGPSSLISSIILSGASNQDPSNGRDGQILKLKHSTSVGQNISQIAMNLGRKSPIEPGSNSHSRSSSGNFSCFVNSVPPNITTVSTSVASPGAQTVLSNTNDHELIFPFEIGRVAQCRACGCCFHLQCFIEADQKCPKCERIQRRNAEMQDSSTDTSGLESSSTATTAATTSETNVASFKTS